LMSSSICSVFEFSEKNTKLQGSLIQVTELPIYEDLPVTSLHAP
jgi:hypothetical protein